LVDFFSQYHRFCTWFSISAQPKRRRKNAILFLWFCVSIAANYVSSFSLGTQRHFPFDWLWAFEKI
jgi:hypothetical protein